MKELQTARSYSTRNTTGTELFASEAYETLVEGRGSCPVWRFTLGSSEEQKLRRGLCFLDGERSEHQEPVKPLCVLAASHPLGVVP